MSDLFGLSTLNIQKLLETGTFSLGRNMLDFSAANSAIFDDLEKRFFRYPHPKGGYSSKKKSTGYTVEELFNLWGTQIRELKGYQFEKRFGLNAGNFSLVKNNKRPLTLQHVCAMCLSIEKMTTQNRYTILRSCISMDKMDPIILRSFVSTSLAIDGADGTADIRPSYLYHSKYDNYCFFAHAAIQAYAIMGKSLPPHFNTNMWRDTYDFYYKRRLKL